MLPDEVVPSLMGSTILVEELEVMVWQLDDLPEYVDHREIQIHLQNNKIAARTSFFVALDVELQFCDA